MIYQTRRDERYSDMSIRVFMFLKGTIAEQVSLKDESITREQIEEALDFVGLTYYIASL